MTHEEFAHICLKIKSGDTSIEIPCCANCKHYACSNEPYANPTTKGAIDNLTKLFDEVFDDVLDEEIESGGEPAKYECRHPVLESDDPFVACWLEMKPEDFCSRFEQRKD